MSHCANKPPARVNITYKDGRKEEFVTDSVPVSVSVRKKAGIQTDDPDADNPSGGCCDVSYDVFFSYKYCPIGSEPNTCGGPTLSEGPIKAPVTGKIIGTKITQFQGTDNAIALTRRGCDGVEQTFNLLGLGGLKLVSYSIHEIKRSDGLPDICNPPDPDAGVCVITIKSESGGILFTKEDECPIKYTVACGEDCPSQHLKCKTTSYPGYKCKPCNEFR